MDIKESIKNIIGVEMESFNKALYSALSTDNVLLQSVIDYYLQTKGKQIRPMLVILSSRLFGEVNDTTMSAAVAVELLHNASLIHDDVVDSSPLRRGRKTVNNIWDNRVAVLVGDFFVSTALQTAIKSNNLNTVSLIAALGKELATGEIDQIETADEHIIDEKRYFNVIKQKTASLFSSCMLMGGYSNGATKEQLEAIEIFGQKLGLCFQIKDDIFDYFSDDIVGKPTGSDLKEGKVSLPLLYAIQSNNDERNSKMRELLMSQSLTGDEIATLVEYAKEMKGIEYAESVMQKLRDEAMQSLSIFPKSEIKDTLIQILDYIISRNY
ncbi:MAG: polyprenyl synthetase family protein [Bacteroidales bacterium]|nr:polyprenyl synthetase family protein [Bacteroidales bacterium]MBR5532946.1 polyprenyl synthetase family protein [Bacteroidales bacterium]